MCFGLTYGPATYQQFPIKSQRLSLKDHLGNFVLGGVGGGTHCPLQPSCEWGAASPPLTKAADSCR